MKVLEIKICLMVKNTFEGKIKSWGNKFKTQQRPLNIIEN